MSIEFAQPVWLWIAALAALVLGTLFVRAGRRRAAAIRLLAAAGPETSVARHRRWLRQGLAITGVAMICVALAHPRAGYRWEQTPHKGVDVMFAIDTSKSMRAADLHPDRLTRAKLAVTDLVRTFEGERVGLIAFAGDAFVQAPLTVDRGVVLESIDALDTDVIPRGGTDVASAIRAAEQAMGSEPDHQKVLFLVSDGEDLEGSALEAARAAGQHGMAIYTVGVGTRQGELVEVANEAGVKELVRDESGQPVRSKLDEQTLTTIAKLTGGAYQPLGADGRGLEALYAVAKARLPERTTASTAHKVYTERFQIPLAFALGCLVLELALGDRRRSRRATAQAASAALGLALVALPYPAAAAPSPARDATSSYNDAVATYRKGDFVQAQEQFASALNTGDVGLQINSYYDLGNARYRAGQATLAKKDRDTTIATWKKALEAYDAALALAPDDADAKFNRDFVARKLAALEAEKQHDEDKKQPKNQSGQDQQPKNKPGQGQGQQPTNKPGQGEQHDQRPAGEGQRPDPQPQASGKQPEREAPDAAGHTDHDAAAHKAGVAGAPGAANDKQSADAAAAASADSARRAAGQLTHGEAMQLLDSVEAELKPLPIHGRSGGHPAPTKLKDW